MTDIAAIETKYNGFTFRSRLEARWAVFFDTMRIDWIYEHEGYETPDGRYVPDFWLPNVYMRDEKNKGVYFEVKPESYEGVLHPKLEWVCNQLKTSGVLAKGMNLRSDDWLGWTGLYQIAEYWDADMMIYPCECGAVKFDYYTGSNIHCVREPACKVNTNTGVVNMWHAYELAIRYRFW